MTNSVTEAVTNVTPATGCRSTRPGVRWPAGCLTVLATVLAVLPGEAPGARPQSAERATLRAIEQAYEVDVGQVQLPGGDAGPLVVRRCATCPPLTLQAGTETTWHLGPAAPATTRSAFEREFRAASIDRTALVYVLFDPGSRIVTRVILDRPVVAAGGVR